MIDEKKWITTREFVRLLYESRTNLYWDDNEITNARLRGVLEEQDILAADEAIVRMAAARMIHMFLRKELHEPDEPDWKDAGKLLDLYDCRTCVNHVAQVYAKDIMKPVRENVFGMREPISQKEAEAIAKRVFARGKTADVRPEPDKSRGTREKMRENAVPVFCTDIAPICMSEEAAEVLFAAKEQGKAVWIDVRSRAQYEAGHVRGALSLPLIEILEKPELLPTEKSVKIIFYCEAGTQSELAAKQAVSAGFCEVFYCAIIAENLARFM